jgi:hypothetical protein
MVIERILDSAKAEGPSVTTNDGSLNVTFVTDVDLLNEFWPTAKTGTDNALMVM